MACLGTEGAGREGGSLSWAIDVGQSALPSQVAGALGKSSGSSSEQLPAVETALEYTMARLLHHSSSSPSADLDDEHVHTERLAELWVVDC